MGTPIRDGTYPPSPPNGGKVDFGVRTLSVWGRVGPLQEKGGVALEVRRGPEKEGEMVEPLTLRTDAHLDEGEWEVTSLQALRVVCTVKGWPGGHRSPSKLRCFVVPPKHCRGLAVGLRGELLRVKTAAMGTHSLR